MPMPPQLSDEQRRAALAKAAEARRKRAAVKEELKAGSKTLRDLLAEVDDDIVGKMKVTSVIESLPGVGRKRATDIMGRLNISTTRRLRGLGDKQREKLLSELAGR